MGSHEPEGDDPARQLNGQQRREFAEAVPKTRVRAGESMYRNSNRAGHSEEFSGEISITATLGDENVYSWIRPTAAR